MPAQPEPYLLLSKRLRDLEEEVRRLRNRSPFANSGMAVTAEGEVTASGSVLVPGDLNVSGNLGVSGNMALTGNLDVTGTFTLPAASIDDSWLANLTGWGAATAATATGWSTSTSMADKASTSLTVPAGYDSAIVVAWGLVTYQDSAPNRFDCRCVIEGNAGPTLANLANTVAQTTVLHSRSLAVTSGQVLNLSVQVLSAVAASSSTNTAVCGGFALFSR